MISLYGMILIFLLNNETVSAIAMAAPIGSMTTSAANDSRGMYATLQNSPKFFSKIS